MSHSRFTRGSGCYVCRSCGHRTRETGAGEANVELCSLCYEIGGLENAVSDGVADDADRELLASLQEQLRKRNGGGK